MRVAQFGLPFGRISRRAFAVAIALLYLAGFLSQMLFAAPAMLRFGVWLFAAAQAALIWLWFTLHANRLRDAGAGIGVAAGIASVYALAVILLMLILAVFSTAETGEAGGSQTQSAVRLVVVLRVLGHAFSDADTIGFWLILLVVLAMIVVPILAAGFSIVTGLRASVPSSSMPAS